MRVDPQRPRVTRTAARPSPIAPQAAAATEADSPYLADEYLVAAGPGDTLDALAAAAGAVVVRPAGHSGYGVLRTTAPERLEAAGARVAPHARIVGAGYDDDDDSGDARKTDAGAPAPAPAPEEKATEQVAKAPVAAPPTWHLGQLGVSAESAPSQWAPWRVAVLDTGVAYETTGRFVAAPGLAGVSFQDPLDLVEMDGHPNDDHQHGTHITSLIASEAAVPGVVPGVTILPVKVLDHQNSGTEYDLVEGIWHAIEKNADVINLSLSFPLGYVPSEALAGALQAAWDAEVVVVAAAGNDGARELSWPAASRIVVSVGASTALPASSLDFASYSNTSPALDVLAPGGELGTDLNRDGYVDGVVAETIHPADPGLIGYCAFQGSSQAAALTSGLAVQLLADGIAPHDIGPALQEGAGGFKTMEAIKSGTGADVASLASLGSSATRTEVYVGLLPYLAELDGVQEPRALVTVVDAAGEPIVEESVVASLYAEEGVYWLSCVTDLAGRCTLMNSGAHTEGEAWAFRVDAVVIDQIAQRPSRALWATEGANVLLTALAAVDGWDTLAVYWPAGNDSEFGAMAEAWSVVDSGTGLLSSPLGVVFRPIAVAGRATEGMVQVDVDGTGLLSSPLGALSFRTLTFSSDGTFGSIQLVGIDGSGLLSSPLGFHANRLFGTGLLSSPLGWSSTIKLDRGTVIGASLEGTAMQHLVAGQYGLVTGSGYAPSAALIGSGVLSVGLAAAGTDTAPASTASSIPWMP